MTRTVTENVGGSDDGEGAAVMWVWLAACLHDGLGLPSEFEFTYLDPDGVTWASSTVYTQVSAYHVTGVGCEPGTWIQVSGIDRPQVSGWFGYSTDQRAESDQFYVEWGSDDVSLKRTLFGGAGELLSWTPSALEYRIEGAQDCTRPEGATDYVCVDQAGPASFLVEGDLPELVLQERWGHRAGHGPVGCPRVWDGDDPLT